MVVPLPSCGREGQWFLLRMGVLSFLQFVVVCSPLFSSTRWLLLPTAWPGAVLAELQWPQHLAGIVLQSHLPHMCQATVEKLPRALPMEDAYGQGQEMGQQQTLELCPPELKRCPKEV